MFYLGTIAGILPYILALSLTILWGGQATVPLFTSHSSVDSPSEIKKESNLSHDSQQSIDFVDQVTPSQNLQIFNAFSNHSQWFAFNRALLFDSAQQGITLLRAPPVLVF